MVRHSFSSFLLCVPGTVLGSGDSYGPHDGGADLLGQGHDYYLVTKFQF